MPRSIQVSDEVHQAIDRDAKRRESDSDVIARWARNLGLLDSIGTSTPIEVQQDRHIRRSPRRVDGFHLFGQHYVVDKWWKLFAKVAEILVNRHPDKQSLLLRSTHVGQNSGNFRDAKEIPRTRLFFEATQSAASMLEETETLLRIFGYDPKKEMTVQEHLARRPGVE